MENPEQKTQPGKNENLIAAICYIPGFFILGPLLKPDSELCLKHSKQGLVLSIVFFFIVILSVISPILIGIIFLIYFALIVIAGYRAYASESWSIPIIFTVSKAFKIENLFKTATNSETFNNEEQPETQEVVEKSTIQDNNQNIQ